MAKQFILREHERQTVESLALVVAAGVSDKLIMLDLSEGGMAVQASEPLARETVMRMQFVLPHTRMMLEATGEVAWAHPSGRAGIRFAILPDTARIPLRSWVAAPPPEIPQDSMPEITSGEAGPPEEQYGAAAIAIDVALIAIAVAIFGASAYLIAGALPRMDKLVGTALLLLVFCGSVYRIVFFPHSTRRPGTIVMRWLRKLRHLGLFSGNRFNTAP